MPDCARERGVIFWDFDGTLAWRDGMWTATLLEVLDEDQPGHGITREALRPHLSAGFPWHEPERSHLGLGEPDDWWRSLEVVLARAYESVGIEPSRAAVLARRVRRQYVEPTRWVLFGDAVPALSRLAALGWRQAIVSNHVPELPGLVEALGLGGYFERVICSAAVGYEKPHPEIYRLALAAMGNPRAAWMVGDNIVADVLGAEAAGLRGILVRRRDERARRRCSDLAGVVELLENEYPLSDSERGY